MATLGRDDGRRGNPSTDDTLRTRLMSDASDLVDEEAAAAQAARDKGRMLLLSFIAMVVVGLGNKIFQPLQFLPMYNYPLFTNLLTTFVYLPTSFAYIFFMLKYGKLITKEATDVPKYKFAIMGCLDSTAGVMQSLAVNFLRNGGLVILLSQAAIPMSMVITKLFLKTKYKGSQYIGAIIVSAGLLVVLFPFFEHPDASSGNNIIVWSVVMIVSCIPMTLSSVYKEKALGETDIDPVYLNGWVALFQFCAAIPLLFPSAAGSKLPIDDLPTNLWYGAKCFVGINSLPTDNCAMGPVYVSIYLTFNLGYNVLIIMILKYGSSNILWLAMTIMVPLGNVAFALPFVPNHKAMHLTDVVGLVLIMAGLFVYRFWSKGRHWLQRLRNQRPDDEEEEEDVLTTPARGPTGVHGGVRRHDTERAYRTPQHLQRPGTAQQLNNVTDDHSYGT